MDYRLTWVPALILALAGVVCYFFVWHDLGAALQKTLAGWLAILPLVVGWVISLTIALVVLFFILGTIGMGMYKHRRSDSHPVE